MKKVIGLLCSICFLFQINTAFAKDTFQSIPARTVHVIAEQLDALDNHKPLWTHDYASELQQLPAYHVETFYHLTGLEYIKQQNKIGPCFVAILLSFIVAIFLYRKLLFNIKQKRGMNRSRIKHLIHTVTLLFPTLILSLFFFSLFKEASPKPLFLSLVQTLAVYFFILVLVRINVCFVLPKQSQRRALYLKRLFEHVTLLISVLLLGQVAQLIFKEQHVPLFITHIASVIYVLALYAILFTLIYNVLSMHLSYNKKKNKLGIGIKLFFAFVFLIIIFKTFLGFFEPIVFLTQNLIYSFLMLVFVIEALHYLWVLNRTLNQPEHPISIAVHNRMGLPAHKKLIEFSILCVLLSFASIRVIGVTLGKIWSIPSDLANAGIMHVKNNIYLFNVHINVPGIARGLILFCIILMLGRLVGVFLTKKTPLQNQKQTQVTVITLTNYAAFILGILTLLVSAGVNLSGFAMVASALSVGIGFGLKNFAADLVAGLILLLSKPLRPGDHIQVENNEGYIQKINLLSTDIKTLKESNIIVPNGTLLSKSVTNYTYKNKFLGITSAVIIKDTGDIDRTKKILLDVAKSHPELHQRGNKKPFVMVDLSAEKTLNIILTLYCTVKDVDKQFKIKSSINSDLIKALKKHDIALKT